MNELPITLDDAVAGLNHYDIEFVNSEYIRAMSAFNKKIVVLDDDPTGVQTVNNIFVYTDWSRESIQDGFNNTRPLFNILTNSRATNSVLTTKIHTDIAKVVSEVSKDLGKEFIIISRSDSTLRGHYPSETLTLRNELEKNNKQKFDGEIIIPFFMEGGRFTINNVHYLKERGLLIPVASSEFALDKTFGYSHSNLAEWIEEKTKGAFKKESVVNISLRELRNLDYEGVYKKLLQITDFNKVTVDAVDYSDLKVFVTVLVKALEIKKFLFRTAAAFPKIIGQIESIDLLTKQNLVDVTNKNGGLIIVGSYVQKTTRQLEHLRKNKEIVFIEINCLLVSNNSLFENEINRVINLVEQTISQGITVVVYTKREVMNYSNLNGDQALSLSKKISDGVTKIVSGLKIRPRFVVAKGGITSSDIGTTALQVKKALVAGQIIDGVPVWKTGKESKFPGLTYVIFPGNVGSDSSLFEVVQKLI